MKSVRHKQTTRREKSVINVIILMAIPLKFFWKTGLSEWIVSWNSYWGLGPNANRRKMNKEWDVLNLLSWLFSEGQRAASTTLAHCHMNLTWWVRELHHLEWVMWSLIFTLISSYFIAALVTTNSSGDYYVRLVVSVVCSLGMTTYIYQWVNQRWTWS